MEKITTCERPHVVDELQAAVQARVRAVAVVCFPLDTLIRRGMWALNSIALASKGELFEQ